MRARGGNSIAASSTLKVVVGVVERDTGMMLIFQYDQTNSRVTSLSRLNKESSFLNYISGSEYHSLSDEFIFLFGSTNTGSA